MIENKSTKILNVTGMDIILSLLVPGLGHLARGWWRKGFLFLASLAIQGGVLYLAVIRHRLAWLAGPSEYWFSTSVLFFLFLVIWVTAILDIHHTIHVSAKEGESCVEGYWEIVTRRFARDLKGLAGLGIILVVCYVALLAPFLARGDALNMDLANALAPSSSKHPLGLDNYGRDILDRTIFGARVALGIGMVATLLNMGLGGVLGLLAGFYRGFIDAVLMRFLEIISAIPFLVLILLLVSLWGSSIPMLIIVMGLFGLTPARIIRSEVLSVREEGYVLYARALGAPSRWIILRHVLPNAFSSLLVVTTMSIGVNIITVAGLSFLGFGVKPPTPSWGAMLRDAQQYMRTAWWMAVYPGGCIAITVFAFNLLGDALRDVLDPRLR